LQLPKPRFKFEKWWLQHETFKEMVNELWSKSVGEGSSIEIWQRKVREFRKKARGRSINVEAANRKKNAELIREYDCLDVFCESLGLIRLL
jgi:hypothetical protein